jgi:membrane-bound acyltransferase YfiQ involved in biofilm formation
MRLPRLSVPPIMLISAASYHIYLFHRIVPEFLGLDKMGSLGVVASIGAGLLCGIGAMALQRLAFARLGQRLHPAPIGR